MQKSGWCLGLMSGTSLDGVDAALLRCAGKEVLEFGPTYFLPYPDSFREKLRGCFGLDDAAKVDPTTIRELTDYHIEAVACLMEIARLTASDIDLVGFHGQTIHHDPANGITVQIGDGDYLSKSISIPVVYDFRSADVAAGGEGAPLAPVYHQALYRQLIAQGKLEPEEPIAVLNIGGVSNITYLAGEDMWALDTGPGNALMDDLILRKTGQAYDEGGKLARTGTIDQTSLNQWFAHPFFQRPAPKSLDRDQFTQVIVEDLSVEDGLATLAAFTVEAINKAQDCCPQPPKKWLVTGGGRKNTYLMDLMTEKLSGDVLPVEDIGWDGDALEAQAFAYLARLSADHHPISFPQTTGVKSPMVGGVYAMPDDE